MYCTRASFSVFSLKVWNQEISPVASKKWVLAAREKPVSACRLGSAWSSRPPLKRSMIWFFSLKRWSSRISPRSCPSAKGNSPLLFSNSLTRKILRAFWPALSPVNWLTVSPLLSTLAQTFAGRAGAPVRQGTNTAPRAASPLMMACWPALGRKMLVLVNSGAGCCSSRRSPS